MKTLQKRLGYIFRDQTLLRTALTHSSYANENRLENPGSNERLEFFGDSILGVVVAEHLFKSSPQLPEGRMTRLRAELVCEQSLVRVARELELGSFLLLGRGEEITGGRERPSILADATEAVIAAMYLDGGMSVASGFIHRHILSVLSGGEGPDIRDYKTELQELVQHRSGQVLEYFVMGESGPDHLKVFETQVRLNGSPIGGGRGRTKKEAEQSAARSALERTDEWPRDEA